MNCTVKKLLAAALALLLMFVMCGFIDLDGDTVTLDSLGLEQVSVGYTRMLTATAGPNGTASIDPIGPDYAARSPYYGQPLGGAVDFESSVVDAIRATKVANQPPWLDVDYGDNDMFPGVMYLNGELIPLNQVKTQNGTGILINIGNLRNALQADINAVYDGTAHGGETFTVGEDGYFWITTSVPGSAGCVDLSGSDYSIGLLGFLVSDLGAVYGRDGRMILNGQNIPLHNISALGDGYDAAANINTVAAALQSDINAVFPGLAPADLTFTVGVDNGRLIITSHPMVQFLATPDPGYRFVNWTEEISGVETELSTNAIYIFELTPGPEGRTLKANFEPSGSDSGSSGSGDSPLPRTAGGFAGLVFLGGILLPAGILLSQRRR